MRFVDVQARLIWMLYQVYTNPDASIWNLVKYIGPAEMKFATKADHLLLIMLDCVRWEATRQIQMLTGNPDSAVKVIITSDYRAGDTDSEHGQDPFVGIDLRVKSSRARHFLIRAAHTVGFTRIGIYCDDNHIHLGIGDFKGLPFDSHVTWVRECPKDGI